MENKFIYTQDINIKNKLLNLGYHLLQENDDKNLYIFENKETFQFDLTDNSKIILSNKLIF